MKKFGLIFGFAVIVFAVLSFVSSSVSHSAVTEELEGTLETMMITGLRGEKDCKPLCFLKVGDKKIPFSPPANAPLMSGQKIKIFGQWKEERIDGQKQRFFRCEKMEAVLIASAPTAKTESADKADILPMQHPVLGEQRTLAAAVVFPDHDTPVFGKKEIEDTVFYHPYSNNFLWEECSGEKMWTTGKCLDGWKGMSKSATEYGYGSSEEAKFFLEMINDLVDLADKEADLAQYDRLIFVRSGRGWGYAFSTLGKWSFSTNDGQVEMSVAVVDERFGLLGNIILSHEYGHGLGLRHNGNKIMPTGQVDTYGDIWSVMGGGGYAQIPAMHKYILGWLRLDQVEIVTESGYYWIDQRELDSGGIKLLVIPSSTSPTLFLEYFKMLGNFDSQVSIYAYESQKDSVLLREYKNTKIDSLVFTDKDWVPVLGSQEFCNPEDGVCIQVTQKIAGETPGAKAEVKITLPPPPPPPPCEEKPPIISVSSGTAKIYAGESFTADVFVENPMAENCGTRTVSIGADLPAMWSASFDPGSILEIPPESAKTTAALVEIPGETPPGQYELVFRAQDEVSGMASAAILKIEVLPPIPPPCEEKPPIISVSSGTAKIYAGESFTADVFVENPMAENCGTRTVSIGADLPAMWSASFDPGSILEIPPESAKTTAALVEIPGETPPGHYDSVFRAQDEVSGMASAAILKIEVLPPIPPPCEAEKIAVSPPILRVKIGETGNVTVALTGADDCPAKGITVTATVISGKKRIFLPFSNGKTEGTGTVIFNITGKKKRRATVLFQAGDLKILAKIKITKK